MSRGVFENFVIYNGNMPPQATPCLFLDRDGVVNVDTGYVKSRAEVRLIPGIANLIQSANTIGIPVIIASNQSGIARGYFTWSKLLEITEFITQELAQNNASLDAVFISGAPPDDASHASWRKPAPGMFNAASKLCNADLAKSLMIGDKWSDILAARAAGVGAQAMFQPSDQERKKADNDIAVLNTHLESLTLVDKLFCSAK